MIKFLITKDELFEILSEFNNNIHVRNNKDAIDEFLKKYEMLYEKLFSSHEFSLEEDEELLNLRLKIESKYRYDPYLEISTFSLVLTDDDMLHSNYDVKEFPKFLIGLKVEFPKDVCYYKISKDEPNKRIVSSKKFKSLEFYNFIFIMLGKITEFMRFSINDKKFKPNILISKKVKENLKNTYFFKHHKCTIV